MIRGLLILLALSLATPAAAAWREAKTRHFLIYSEGSASALQAFATKVERFDAFLRQRTGVPLEQGAPRLTIFMLKSNEAVGRLMGNRNIAGVYSPRAKGSFAVVHRELSNSKYDLGADEVLFHEYAHHFMLRNFPVAYPAWYVEGFAEFLSTTDFTPEGLANTGTPPYYRGFGLLLTAPFKTQQLVTSGGWGMSPERTDAFYGWSWLLTHYLVYENARRGQASKYLDALNKGATSLDAAKTAFGDLDQLDRELKAYLARSKVPGSQTRTAVVPVGSIEIAELTPALSDLVPLRLALMREPEKNDLPPLIAKLRAAAAKHPNEPEAHRLLAEALLASGDLPGADAAADAALALAPASARALMVKAEVAMQNYEAAPVGSAERAKAARSWILKANRADTADPLPLIANFRMARLTGGKPNKVALDGLALAFRMIPEAADVRTLYATALANERRLDEAIRLVETVAYAPHAGPDAAQAQQWLERLKKAKAGDAEALDSIL